jgi:hypothetical protein
MGSTASDIGTRFSKALVVAVEAVNGTRPVHWEVASDLLDGIEGLLDIIADLREELGEQQQRGVAGEPREEREG